MLIAPTTIAAMIIIAPTRKPPAPMPCQYTETSHGMGTCPAKHCCEVVTVVNHAIAPPKTRMMPTMASYVAASLLVVVVC